MPYFIIALIGAFIMNHMHVGDTLGIKSWTAISTAVMLFVITMDYIANKINKKQGGSK